MVAGPVPVSVRSVELPVAARELWQAPLLLVRPDQHVAWRGSDPAALAAAVCRASGGVA